MTGIGNDAISSSKKHLEKTDQDCCINSNKRPLTRSSKKKNLNYSFSTNQKHTQSISSQKIYEVNAHVRDPPRCYVFSERETDRQNSYSP